MVGFILFFCYPLAVISLSVYSSITKEMNSERYFFADKNINWLFSGLSLSSSIFFSPYLLGFSLSGYQNKLTLIYALVSVVLLFAFGKILLPRYSNFRINTIPEYFEIHFGKTFRYVISLLYILMNIGIRLTLTLTVGSILIYTFTDLDPYFSLLFFLVITSVSLIISGLKAEIFINLLQAFFVIAIAAGFTYWFFTQNNFNYLGIQNAFSNALKKSNPDLTPTELIIALPLIGCWFLCADQGFIQKSFSVSDIKTVKKSILFLIIYQLIPLLIFTLPAVIIFNNTQDANLKEIQRLFFNYLPEVLKSLFTIVIVFIITSLIASYFINTASLITFDFYRTLKPNASDRELVLVGRITIIIFLFISIVLLPITHPSDFKIYLKLFYLFLYLASLISAFLIIGFLFQFIKKEAALSIFFTGLLLIFFKSIHEIFFYNHYFDIEIFNYIVHANFLEYSIFIFSFACGLSFIISKINLHFKTERKKSISKKILLALPIYCAIIGLIKMINI